MLHIGQAITYLDGIGEEHEVKGIRLAGFIHSPRLPLIDVVNYSGEHFFHPNMTFSVRAKDLANTVSGDEIIQIDMKDGTLFIENGVPYSAG